MAAKHIQMARDNDMEVGLQAFLAAPSSKLSPNYATIVGNGRRSDASMLKAYCNIFGDKVASTRPSKAAVVTNSVVTDMIAGDRQSLIEAIAERLGIDVSQLTIGETVEDEDDLDAIVTNDEFITRDVAWSVLGRGVDRPQVTSRPETASNAQLWRINERGLFSAEEVARLNALA